MTLDNITGITKGSYTGDMLVKEQEKRFCCYQSTMCEYATDYGYCKITGCTKLHELHEAYKGGEDE